MARRELLDVAAAVAGSFVSRNNDVNGYWGLGLLRSYADHSHLRSIRLDVLNHAEPRNDAPALIADAYCGILARQLTIRKIAPGIVAKAEVVLTFDPDAPNIPRASTYGTPFSCTVRLTDHLDREFECTLVGCCAPHDPLRELQSGRVKRDP